MLPRVTQSVGRKIRFLTTLLIDCGDNEVTYPEECDGGSNCDTQCKCPAGSRPDGNAGCVTNSTLIVFNVRVSFSNNRCQRAVTVLLGESKNVIAD